MILFLSLISGRFRLQLNLNIKHLHLSSSNWFPAPTVSADLCFCHHNKKKQLKVELKAEKRICGLVAEGRAGSLLSLMKEQLTSEPGARALTTARCVSSLRQKPRPAATPPPPLKCFNLHNSPNPPVDVVRDESASVHCCSVHTAPPSLLVLSGIEEERK